ncbi:MULTISPECIES: D-alanyl-D-alanine carboxypeptidase family protein [Microbacterium]|jgi:D-alanyl-D-alanine carboxypeptidase (penicillin-binding protein 5/6)|uniref:D-alanyl-D-alanine carboxypeptidase family protein n=1 Tax=Microbacterium TaxID=33882 RepID=UPI001D1759C1|nr:serine hydrolase [Microbacterium testaceum]MCC4249521.1 serine hydrolase [Microbacterium testaceum]
MGETHERSDELAAFADLLDDAPAASGSGRAGRIALLVVLVTVLVVLTSGGGYVWWASTAPLGPPTLTTQPPPVAAGTAATVRLPPSGSMRVSVAGGEAYLGADVDGAWATSGGDDPRPIASIAKLVTALVVLDRHPLDGASDPGPTLAFTEADTDLYDQFYVRGATIARMPDGSRLSLHDALATMLLPSASNYAVAVARWAYGSEGAYVDAARSWLAANGLTSTRIVDATGIDERNTSTPRDLVALGKIAEANPALAAIVAMPSISLPDGPGYVTNTNDLLGIEGVRGLKTGNLGEGTFNLLFSSLLDVGIGAPLQITGVRLGGQTHDSTDQDVRAFLQSIRAGFHEVEVGTALDTVGEITTAWGSRAEIVLARSASLMTWSDTPVTATLDVRTPETYADGETVGTVTWTAGPNTASAEVAISGALEEPTLWWRLTHPGELG